MMFWQSDYGPALTLFLDALERFRVLGDNIGVALSQLPLALMQAGMGAIDEAIPRYEESLALFEEAGDHWGRSIAINAMCWLATGLDLEQIPDSMFEEGVAAARKAGTDQEIGMALANLGRRKAFRGALIEGERIMKQSLQILSSHHYRGPATTQMESLAEIALLRGQFERAVRVYGATSEVRSQLGTPVGEPFLSRLNGRVASLREKFTAEEFDLLWESGARLGWERAVE
ncbi:MAG: hypothetical protein QOK47_868, partial [Actinomycetota bacterium]|nr:hypothetical protein [Actinomycetota bacterium]